MFVVTSPELKKLYGESLSFGQYMAIDDGLSPRLKQLRFVKLLKEGALVRASEGKDDKSDDYDLDGDDDFDEDDLSKASKVLKEGKNLKDKDGNNQE